MIDEVRIKIKAGNGGNGCISFRREKFVPKGGPDGGDGGDGGSVYLITSTDLFTLRDFSYKSIFQARNGEHGKGGKKTGRKGESLFLKVPPGTLVKTPEGEIIADLTENNKEFLIAVGGRGGKGNVKFANSRRQTPRFAQKGIPGEEKDVILELKSIADVGIMGMPNVGKSTLLSQISYAKPKIANYPFTTLSVNLGVANINKQVRFICADIPGLIKDAHKGVGLGFKFLKHIERTKLLLHVLDLSSSSPVEDFHAINNEISRYNEKLMELKQIVVLNKADLPGSTDKIDEIKKAIGKKYKIVVISALTGKNLKRLTSTIASYLKKMK